MSQIRTDAVRQLLRLVGECCELRDAVDRRRRFLEGMAQMSRSQVGLEGAFRYQSPSSVPEIVEVHDVGWSSESDRNRVYGWVMSHSLDTDPLNHTVLGRLSKERVVTLARSDVMSTRDWALTEIRNDVHRPSHVDESLVSVMRGRNGDEVHCLVLKRGWGERPYDAEDRELLHLAHSECAWMFEGPRDPQPALAGDWSPRERDTLKLLLTGASEKRIAATLGLSAHTVHDYVKGIYRKASVGSRAELMALAIAEKRATQPR